MLQVDENIGGRQDQKNNGLQTKTLAVGLLMVLGCFAVGYFSATTTTATAHTRGVSSPNGNLVDGMVSNLQDRPIAIRNETPYRTHYDTGLVRYYSDDRGPNCHEDLIREGIPSGRTWHAVPSKKNPFSRGVCLVGIIEVSLALPDQPDGVVCTPYRMHQYDSTAYAFYSILMKGDGACCVVSELGSHATKKCP